MTKPNGTVYSNMLNDARDEANRAKMGREIVQGSKSASEVFGRVPTKPIHSKESGVITLPVADVVAMIDSLEESRAELIARGIPISSIADDLKLLNSDALKCLRMIEAAHKRNQESAVVKSVEWSSLELACTSLQNSYRDAAEGWMEMQRREKGKYVALMGEHGSIWLTNTVLRLLTASVMAGKHTLLTGEPGCSKTDTARALALHTDKKLFHLEVSGFSDVSQLEQERYIDERNGASITTSVPTALINALEAHERGESVLLVIDEIARVTDPAILNPLMLLMSHNEFHAVVGKKVYKVDSARFVIVATANIMLGFNFSGNSRRGMDDALMDRFRIVQLTRPPAEKIAAIVAERCELPFSDKVNSNMLKGIEFLYALAKDENSSRLITVRSMIDVASAWVGLDPHIYQLSEVVDQILAPKAKSKESLSGIIAALEGRGI